MFAEAYDTTRAYHTPCPSLKEKRAMAKVRFQNFLPTFTPYLATSTTKVTKTKTKEGNLRERHEALPVGRLTHFVSVALHVFVSVQVNFVQHKLVRVVNVGRVFLGI